MDKKTDFPFHCHFSDLLLTAAPYMSRDLYPLLSLLINLFDLTMSSQSFSRFNQKSIFKCLSETENKEELLSKLRPVCTDSELKVLNTISTFLTMKKMFDAYQTIRSFMPEDSDFFSSSNSSTDSDMINSLLSNMLSKEQRETFEMLREAMKSDIKN